MALIVPSTPAPKVTQDCGYMACGCQRDVPPAKDRSDEPWYCSDHCAEQDDEAEACGCSHPGCTASRER